MRAHHIFIASIAAGALAAGAILLPGGEEQAAMLARDGLYEKSLVQIALLRQSGNQSPHILMQSFKLHEMLGQTEQARQDMDALLAAYPNDITAHEAMADQYLSDDQLEPYLRELDILARLQPTRERVTQLVSLYRLNARFDDELRVMSSHRDLGILGQENMERLGALLASRGEFESAAEILELAERTAPPQEYASRLLLLEVLLRLDRATEASAHARRWIQAWRSPYLAGQAIVRIAKNSERRRDAITLAELSAEVNPEGEFSIISLLSTYGEVEVAQQLLLRWAQLRFTPEQRILRDYVATSIAAGDPTGPFRKLQMLALNAPAAHAMLAEELAIAFGLDALAPYRQELSYDVLAQRPLLAAELADREGSPLLTRHFFQQVDVVPLSSRDQARWFKLLHRTQSDQQALATLLTLWRAQKLPYDLEHVAAEEARRLGHMEDYAAVRASLVR